MRILALGCVVLLAGCIAERDDEIVNEQGNSVGSATLSLNGFWDGEYDGAGNLRVLIYEGVVYAVDNANGYYGTLTFNTTDRTVPTNLTSYALNPLMNTAGSNRTADGTDAAYFWDVQLGSIGGNNNALFGGYSIDGTNTGNVELTREGTWSDNSPLSKLTAAGKWTSTGYELVFSGTGSSVTFTGVATPGSGCIFRGNVTNLNPDNNLYRVVLTKQESCPAFNENNATGYAGFNADGDLEFYLRSNTGNSLYFMTFTPPATTTTPTPTPDPDAEEDPAAP